MISALQSQKFNIKNLFLLVLATGVISFVSYADPVALELWTFDEPEGQPFANWVANTGSIGSLWNYGGFSGGASTDGNGNLVVTGKTGSVYRNTQPEYSPAITTGVYRLTLDISTWDMTAGSINFEAFGDVNFGYSHRLAALKFEHMPETTTDPAYVRLQCIVRSASSVYGYGGGYMYSQFDVAESGTTSFSAYIEFDLDNDTAKFVVGGIVLGSVTDFDAVDLEYLRFFQDNFVDTNNVKIDSMGLYFIPAIDLNAPILSLETLYESNSGESITIDVTPVSSNFSYQWYFNDTPIAENLGGTAKSFSINGTNTHNGDWAVEVTNDIGTTRAEFVYRVFVDSDGDGLSNYREINITNTDPNLSDSDFDGLNDNYEINRGHFSVVQIATNSWYDAKLDAENRGGRLAILNTQERIDQANDYLSNRAIWDNLWIGLKYDYEQQDFQWINGGALTFSNWNAGEPNFVELTETVVYIHPSYADNPLKWNNHAVIDTQTNTYLLERNSDPNNADSDGDGISDGLEVTTGTDPNNADTDEDGLTDDVETNTGIYVNSSDTGTNPSVSDSDRDGISDNHETATGVWQSATDTGTNPNIGDSDGDILSDGVETNSGSFVGLSDTGTDPNSADSDGDGFTDHYEIYSSYDPTSSVDTPDAILTVKTAIELEFHGAIGGTYRIEHSIDLGVWTVVEDNIQGESSLVERLHSIDDYNHRFFRVIRTDQ